MINDVRKLDRLTGLTALRGFAALVLVIFHVHGIPNLSVSTEGYSLIKCFGSGVPLFYALSAFSLFLGYEKMLEKEGGVQKFYIKRFFRIAPLFYVMLVLWLVVNRSHFGVNPEIGRVMLSLIFAFGLVPGHHEGIVWASWSIGVEWIYYAFFPIFLLLCRGWFSSLIVLVISIVIGSQMPVLLYASRAATPSYEYMNFMNQLPCFCCGMLAFHLIKRYGQSMDNLRNVARWSLSWALLLVPIFCIYLGFNNGFPYYVINKGVGWQSIPWMMFLLGAVVGLPRLFDNRLTRFFGELSFSLYLTNPIVILALNETGVFKWVYSATKNQDLAFWGSSAIALSVVTLVSWTTYKLIEVPGVKFGDKVIASSKMV